ncbi:hypothetical protein HID58_004362 [Brassica napus]|uniref:Uncharacterized protein n=1 Tax=Brassica napus TaxID=3708 RepID=A0ABQ8E5J6_BRANA|nr:hypothetical protein HID58_004362 [Brassica napus]
MFGNNIQVETVKITKEVKETDVSMEKEGPPIHTLLSWLKKKIPNKQRKDFQEARMKQEMVMMKRQQQGQGQCQSNGGGEGEFALMSSSTNSPLPNTTININKRLPNVAGAGAAFAGGTTSASADQSTISWEDINSLVNSDDASYFNGPNHV